MNVTLRQAEVGLAPGYMTGFGNGFETEALPGPCRWGATRRSGARTGCMRNS